MSTRDQAGVVRSLHPLTLLAVSHSLARCILPNPGQKWFQEEKSTEQIVTFGKKKNQFKSPLSVSARFWLMKANTV